jgi:penicillin-binding protein 1A
MKHAFGGKTGTTNGYTDAWFIGFSPSVTCGTWIGFDNRETLGEKETGAKAALPMWMDFMKVAVAGKPDESFSKPNAPKKQLDIPGTPAEDVPKLPKDDDEPQMNDDSGDKGTEPDKTPDTVPEPQTPPQAAPVVPTKPAATPPATAPSNPPQV